jgi:TolA-binding protein
MHFRTLAVAALLAAVSASAADAQARASYAANRGGAVRAAEFPQDPAHAMYRQAREALSGDDFARAARLFQQVRQRHPRSQYTPDAMYWEAFARYRLGGTDQLRTALGGLEAQLRDHPRAATRGDARELATRIRGELARRGDARAAQGVTEQAGRPCERGGDDDNRVAALNALLQMDAEQAMPILRRVLARRDACSEKLRAHAVFLVAQKRTSDTEEVLLGIARQDPSKEVREQAVFWLSQVGTERAVDILSDILRTSRDEDLQEKAVFALSQHGSARAGQLLRDAAERNPSRKVREQAIFWIGQRGTAENAEYLRTLFGRLEDPALKEKVLFSLSQMQGAGNGRFLLSVAQDGRQPAQVRKQAIFWAGQAGVPVAELSALYDRLGDQESKEQVIFALSQRSGDRAAVDKLIDIARRERDRELREKAVFWLGQSRDPRAARILSEIIDQ